MSDREIITGYRENVIAWRSILECIEWNQRHGLPVLTMPAQIQDLKRRVLQFEDVLDSIQDRRTRNILRCRYALGMSIQDVADYMELSEATTQRICANALASLW